MKKFILLALGWPIISYPLYAQKEQKENTKNSTEEIIIIKRGDKEKKLTIETKDGDIFLNGKPASEYKEDDVNVIRQKFGSGRNFLYTPEGKNFQNFGNDWKDKGFLGVTTEKTDGGVKITDISNGSAAEKAGLKEGDIITKIGDKNITDEDELFEAVNGYKPNDEVSISYKREGKTNDVKATLGERRNFSQAFSFNSSKWDSGFHFKMPKISHQPFAMSWGSFKGKLGLRIEDTENESGAKVIYVHDESAAAKAGVKENDIITEVNGNKVKDVNEVRKKLAEVTYKTSYNIKVKRNGSDMNFEIKVPKRINKADL